mgnify:CR=1 FL=1
MENKYWLSEPAGDWELTLPLGNGRLGASVWGNIDNDRACGLELIIRGRIHRQQGM